MREFTDKELYLGLEYAKSLDQNAGHTILTRFQNEQPVLAQTLFGVFPSLIAEQDQNVAHLFMDLVFDVICVFEKTSGTLPSQQTLGMAWLQEKAALVDAEMTAMMSGKPHSESVFETDEQQGLVQFLHDCIDEYLAEHPAPGDAVRMIKTLIFVTVQLFCSLHDAAGASKTLH
ncbi:hypothetical protein ACQE3E_21045 [Methylomonas sp. MED-D]|uniref:hypothetical protein n=1 Tax=unclassified Methylomonas TaxID=2608980 RepID=UPI0028A4B464|nr:hypothetical protein [Methylomonas sp. MV1]MDT4332066.1 hypothetical protein [Methylomonas sp. MV1]